MDNDVHCYRFPRPSVTTDVVTFAIDEGKLQVLLVERKEAPLGWALPGGFLQVGERAIELGVAQGETPPSEKFDFSLEGCARRELVEETGVAVGALHQLAALGDANRDPRGRYITVAYWTLVHKSQHMPKAGSDARAVQWCDVDTLPPLAFDHEEIVKLARDAVTARQLETHLFFELMPAQFTYPDFHKAFEAITGRTFNRTSLHRRVHPYLQNISPVSEPDLKGERRAHRPADLYDKQCVIAGAVSVLDQELDH